MNSADVILTEKMGLIKSLRGGRGGPSSPQSNSNFELKMIFLTFFSVNH